MLVPIKFALINEDVPNKSEPAEPKMIPDRSSSRDSSENGVSSRVEACRKRVRMTRADQKGPIEAAKPAAGNPVACSVEARTEISRSASVLEARAERLDEAGIT